jgi:hypothetical protein
MATVTANSNSLGVVNFASGSYTSAASDVINLGFVPRFIQIVNSTDAAVYTKQEGMAAAASVKVVTAGTQTIDTGSAILINADGTVTVAIAASKALSWVAFG